VDTLFPRQRENTLSNSDFAFDFELVESRLFIRHKPILSSKKMLHTNYDRQVSFAKKNPGRDPQRAWRQYELTGGKPPVVK
jgi:hypothetical protein